MILHTHLPGNVYCRGDASSKLGGQARSLWPPIHRTSAITLVAPTCSIAPHSIP